jgi:methylated-DNA-protein-cysteine methyltransferase-like protein
MSARPPTPFTVKVIATIRGIPRGRVATYRQVARLAGKEHASRGVSWILNSMSKKHALPWQRVVSSKGRIAFKPGAHHFVMQRRRLEAEGVQVDPFTGEIDMERFQYRKKVKPTPPRRLSRSRG